MRNHSIIVKRLHDLIANYNKTRRIVWTPETTAAFHEMKLQLSKCSTMHLMSDTAPITLHTDSSDYSVGGYLFQTVNGIGQPVAFVSNVALYHTSTYILTYGWYVTMLTDPRSFYGYAHVYGSVSRTSTRTMSTLLIS